MTNMQVRYLLVAVGIFCLCTVECGEHPDGISQVSRAQDALGNYQFSYSVANNEGEHFRKEGTDSEGRVVGSYGLTHNDGTRRVVDYVADQHGFRAAIRSNEPGVVPSESTSVVHPSQPLAVAATSGGGVFGERLKAAAEDSSDETSRESRQRNFDDYRPLSPVAYYPTDVRSPRLTPPAQRPLDGPRSPRVLAQTPAVDPKPVYHPPIDPHSIFRRPVARDTDSDRDYYTTSTSRKPFIPPYGGFDDDPLPEVKHPSVSMTTIHGGLGSRRHLPHAPPTPAYGSGNYPSHRTPDGSDFGFPRFPPISSDFNSPQRPLSQFPPQTPLFSPPSYEGGPHNFVLRAVPIPNGIQAVRVDPTNGRVYERLVYPLYLRHDGHPAYDRNILLHNDDDEPSGYLDIPERAAYRGARDRPFDDSVRSNFTFDEGSLSRPTAADMAWVQRQLSAVEGFDVDPDSLSSFSGSEGDRFSSQLRMRHTPGLFDYRSDEAFFRTPRQSGGLKTEETASQLDASASDAKESVSEIEKEGN